MPRSATLALSLALSLATLASGQSSVSLQERVDLLAEQVHLRYRHHPPSLVARRDAIAATLDAWNQASSAGPSTANRQLLTEWIDSALRAAMPGGSGVMPATPSFVAPEPVAPAAPQAEPIPDPIESATALPKPVAEPTEAPAPKANRPGDSSDRVARSNTVRSQFSAPRATEARSTAKPVTPAVEPAEAPSTPRRSKWSRNPSAAPLKWRDPFVDDPDASPNPLRSGVRRQSNRPTIPAVAKAKIDLRQLSADIRGYNAAVRDLQADVMQVRAADLNGLIRVADELSHLEERRQFLDLYRGGLTASQQAMLPNSPSVELIRELVLRKAETIAEQSSPQQAERRAIEQLRERLARIGGADAF
ncbi:MAG: hypothetical protein AAF266_00195 [Planctomycetota bacterium]